MNQREIKFRAWDKDKKVMYFSDSLTFQFYKDRTPTIGGGYTQAGECILMQFTGLKDKNKKEIYEGDIVKMENGEIGEVIYKDCCFMLERKNTRKYIEWPSEFFEDCEVIGNVYENPELSNQRSGGIIKTKKMKKEIKRIILNLSDLKPGMVVDILDLHNGTLQQRLRSLADSIDNKEKGKSIIRVTQSSFDCFFSDLLGFFGKRLEPINKEQYTSATNNPKIEKRDINNEPKVRATET